MTSFKAQRQAEPAATISWLDTMAREESLDSDDFHDEDGHSLYPVLPLRETLVFPKMVAPLVIERDLSLRAIDVALEEDSLLVAVAQRDLQEEDPLAEDLYSVGVEIKIVRVLRMPDGSTSILAQGRQRVRVLELIDEGSHYSALVRPIWESVQMTQGVESLMRAVLSMFEKCVDLSPHLSEEAYVAALNIDDPGWLADLIASTLQINLAAKQEILETIDPNARLQQVSILLGKELDVLELEQKIHARVQQEVDRSQREYFLREQLRVIQAELGDLDEQGQTTAGLKEQIEAANMPKQAREKAEQELSRLAAMPSLAPEYSMIRTYLEWLIELPWSTMTEDNMDINHAAQVLDRNHFGLSQAKERILEHLAVRKLAGSKMRTPILCLVGPPGTGKTSMGRSVAQALGRKFVRVSLGGVRDEAEIRGHRRTYVGALPGRILQAMRTAGVINPVFMLDEIDKLGLDFRGDPAAALLEVLDPEQNYQFSDHYLDLDYDLSQVFFIATANLLDPIPEPLLDRMEVIYFSGYLEEEKVEIARRFLVPRQIEQTGLASHGLAFTEPALAAIIRQYTYEAGLRNLERSLASVCRKIARRVAAGQAAPHRITAAMLPAFLGPPEYAFSPAEQADEVGVATGLAWTAAGGDLVHVEVTLMPGKGNLILTGQLGEIMQESAQAALSYARSHAAVLGIAQVNFDELDIHVHLPEGAIPKDGPSAGVTMATALISALSGRPVRRDVAMTGEVTLRGHVLPVGGLKEKAIAAHRSGLKTVVIPRRNEKDLTEMPARIKRGLRFVLVQSMEEVLHEALVAAQDVTQKPTDRRSRPSKAAA